MEIGTFCPVSGNLTGHDQVHGVERTNFQRRSSIRALAFDQVVGHPVTDNTMLPVVRAGQQFSVHGDDKKPGVEFSNTGITPGRGYLFTFVYIKPIKDITYLSNAWVRYQLKI